MSMQAKLQRVLLSCVAALCATLATPALAAGDRPGTQSAELGDLGDLSIEELMDISVTSVAKKRTRLSESAAAISVISQEDIARSGYTSIPELLRMVPGLDVARISANEWAISARGFNGHYANKLLVLVDGRTVYTPSSGGVYWNVQDVLLQDLERIEVIRGPGATLWGANAVNGVINIITKSAQETEGRVLSAAFGSQERPAIGVRHGGRLGDDLFYRTYVSYFDRSAYETGDGHDVADDWSTVRGGFRLDWRGAADTDSLTLQGEAYDGDAGKIVTLTNANSPHLVEVTDLVAHNSGFNLLMRWTCSFSPRSQLTIQTYYDQLKQGFGFGTEYHDLSDLDMQYHIAIGERHDVVWGVGYRYTRLRATPSFTLIWTPETERLNLFEAFAQDDIALVPARWYLTLGSKLERNDLTGFEIQPSVRLRWMPNERQTVWAALSRATRTPALFERNSRLNLGIFETGSASPPVWVTLFGNRAADEEKLLAYEFGVRFEPARHLSVDIAAFYNQYDDLLGYVANAPGFELTPPPPHVLISSTMWNDLSGHTYGVEIAAQWQVTDRWKVTGSYTGLRMDVRPNAAIEAESPQQQAQLRTNVDLPNRIGLNGSLSYVDRVVSVSGGGATAAIDSYVRLDLGMSWRPYPSLELGVWGQNLLERRHPEYSSVQTTLVTEIPRTVLARALWQF